MIRGSCEPFELVPIFVCNTDKYTGYKKELAKDLGVLALLIEGLLAFLLYLYANERYSPSEGNYSFTKGVTCVHLQCFIKWLFSVL